MRKSTLTHSTNISAVGTAVELSGEKQTTDLTTFDTSVYRNLNFFRFIEFTVTVVCNAINRIFKENVDIDNVKAKILKEYAHLLTAPLNLPNQYLDESAVV